MNKPQQRHIYFDRLHEAGMQPWYVRIPARLFCHSLVAIFHLITAFFRGLRGTHPSIQRRKQARIVLTGTFFADNWLEAHVRPLASSKCCEHVWVVADHSFVPMDNVTYVSAPRWLQWLIGCVAARSLMFVITAAAKRANVVGGFHLLCNGLLALMVARMLGAQAMYFCVGGWAEIIGGGARSETRLFRKIGKDDAILERNILRAVKEIDLTLTMGTRAKKYLRSKGVTRPIKVMPGGIDPSRFKCIAQTKLYKYDILFVGRLVPIKRLDILLDIVESVVKKKPSVRVGVVGDGPMRAALESRALQLGILANVAFVGRSTDVASWLQQTKIFLLTSDSEGLPLSVMEAMMSGVPVIVSDVGDLGDLVANGINGWRVPRRNVQVFTEKILWLLDRNKEYASFSTAARKSAMKYSIESMVCNWDHILEHLFICPKRTLAG